jgi:hypothetical protein
MATILVERMLAEARAVSAEVVTGDDVTSLEAATKPAGVHSLTESSGMSHAAHGRAAAKAHMPATKATAEATVAAAASTAARVGRADGQSRSEHGCRQNHHDPFHGELLSFGDVRRSA